MVSNRAMLDQGPVGGDGDFSRRTIREGHVEFREGHLSKKERWHCLSSRLLVCNARSVEFSWKTEVTLTFQPTPIR